MPSSLSQSQISTCHSTSEEDKEAGKIGPLIAMHMIYSAPSKPELWRSKQITISICSGREK